MQVLDFESQGFARKRISDFIFVVFCKIQCKFTKIVCMSMPHRLMYFDFFHEAQFSCIKKKKENIIKITAFFSFFNQCVL